MQVRILSAARISRREGDYMPRRNRSKPVKGMSDSALKSIRAEVKAIQDERRAEREAARPARRRNRKRRR